MKYIQALFYGAAILHGDSDIKETETPEPLSAVFGSSDSKIGQILDSQQCDDKCMALAVLDVAYCEQQLGTHDELVTVEGVATKFVLSHPPYPIAD